MTDVFSKEERSRIMSRIRAKNTKLETDFLKRLSAKLYPKGIRYRKHYSKLAGKPDVVFIKSKVAVFIDGEFWHGKDYKKLSRSYSPYWKNKIKNNMERDLKHKTKLKKMGYRVLRFWGNEVKKNPDTVVRKIEQVVH